MLEVRAKEENGKSYVAHSVDEARAMVASFTDGHPLKYILGAMLGDGKEAADALKDRLAGWFDGGMGRVSGWYKRSC